jgi:hypothetical protein
MTIINANFYPELGKFQPIGGGREYFSTNKPALFFTNGVHIRLVAVASVGPIHESAAGSPYIDYTLFRPKLNKSIDPSECRCLLCKEIVDGLNTRTNIGTFILHSNRTSH